MIKKIYLTFILISSVLGCTQETIQNVSPGAESSPVEATIGTGDSGGGNGVNGKALEEYRISLDSLESYNQIVAPHIQAIKNKIPEFGMQLELIFKNKVWYLVPVKLATIRSEEIGVAFSTEQLALQNTYEIWLDQGLFEKMTLAQQATLLIHEALMGLKINLDKTYKDALTKRRSPVAGIEIIRKEDYIIEISKLDYSRIRTMTSYIADGLYRTNTTLFIDHLSEMEFGYFISMEYLQQLRSHYGHDLSTTQILQWLEGESSNIQTLGCELSIDNENRTLFLKSPQSGKQMQLMQQDLRPKISYKGVVEIKLYTQHDKTWNSLRSAITIQVKDDRINSIEVQDEVYSYNLKNGLEWKKKDGADARLKCSQPVE